jgi:hypothetical protein
MKTQISTIKPLTAHPPAEAGSPAATCIWTSGDRTSRADAAMVATLTEDAVDAAFGEESFCFVSENTQVVSESATMVQSLSSQLAMLESQCEQLRKILDTVSVSS